MTITDTEFSRIQRNLAMLMKNSTALSSKFYDLFVTTTPMDVELRVWTSDNEFQTMVIPNRAKGNIPVRLGKGDPNNVVDASYGTLYIDEDTQTVFIKLTEGGIDSGWNKVITSKDLSAHETNSLAHQGFLAGVHGDEHEYFQVADLNPEDEDNGSYAINKNSFDYMIGGLNNLETGDKSNIVAAINEVVDLDTFDVGCVAAGQLVDTVTNSASYLTEKITTSGAAIQLNTGAGISIVTTKNKKIELKKNLIVNVESLKTANGKCSIYIDCTNQDDLKLVALPGEYIVDTYKPSFIVEGDAWFNVGVTPHALYVAEVSNSQLSLVEKDYVFVGTVEVDYE